MQERHRTSTPRDSGTLVRHTAWPLHTDIYGVNIPHNDPDCAQGKLDLAGKTLFNDDSAHFHGDRTAMKREC